MGKKSDKISVDSLDEILNDYKDQIIGSCSGDDLKASDIISTGSFWFDYVLGGGYRSGCWSRFYADPECGKTSKALSWARSWQEFYGEKARVIFFNAEGRVTKDLLERSGVNLSSPYFRIISTNQYEAIYGIIERLVKENGQDFKYFMVLDSTDACVRAADLAKDYNESEKMAGGASIASAAGKRLSLLFNHGGHHLFLTSQVRATNLQGGKEKRQRTPAAAMRQSFIAHLSVKLKSLGLEL
jgi:hypothetical protein